MNMRLTHAGGSRRHAPHLLAILVLLLAPAASWSDESLRHPAAPGTLFVEGVVAEATLVPIESGDERTWTWAWGALTVSDPDLVVTTALGHLSWPYGRDVSGASQGRRLLFREGDFPVDGPLLLRGEGFRLFVSSGRLTVSPEALVLADGPPDRSSMLGQTFLFLGVLLLTVFMVMKARARTSSS